MRNRAIVIHTISNPGEYHVSNIGDLTEVANDMRFEPLSQGAGRTRDTWIPLLEVAKAIDDISFEQSVNNAIEAEQNVFRSGQQYEADSVVLQALDSLTWDEVNRRRINNDVDLSKVAEKASDIGEVKLLKKQLEELLMGKGFSVTFTHGVKYVRANTELLGALLQEY